LECKLWKSRVQESRPKPNIYIEISRALQSSPEFVRVHRSIGKREVNDMPDIIVDNLEISTVLEIGLVLMYSVLSDMVHT